jgi:nitric oxide reductase NorD protein
VRRDAAIALLVDASASTDGWVAGDRRIIDVEKEALLIVGEALASLGDPHAVLAFASSGPSRVTVRVLKRFDEAAGGGDVHRRIAGSSRMVTLASVQHSGMSPRGL